MDNKFINALRRSCFEHMRYVMAILGSIAFALLPLLKHNETANIDQYRNHYQNFPPLTTQLTIFGTLLGVSLIILALCGFFFRRLSAKWAMVFLMSFHICQFSLCTCLSYNEFYLWVAILSSITHIMSPCVFAVAMHGLIAHWSPPTERSVITAFVYAGISAGAASISTFEILDEAVLIVCVVWLLLWCVLIDESPQQQKRLISPIEKDYIWTQIESYTPCVNEDTSLGQIIVSQAFYSVLLVECSITLIQTQLLTPLPKATLGPEKSSTASMKYIAQTSFILMYGIIQTLCLKKKIMTFDNSRKLSSFRAVVIPLSLLAISYILKGHECIIIGNIIIGTRFCGAIVNIIDISPKYAAFLMAIVQIFSQVLTIASWVLVELVCKTFKYYDATSLVSIPIAIFAIMSAVLYYCWGSTAQQTLATRECDEEVPKMYEYGPLENELKERY